MSLRDRVREAVADALRNGDGHHAAQDDPSPAARGDAWEGGEHEQPRQPSGRDGDGEQATHSEPWEEPIPLAEVPAVDPFPVDVLPPALVRFVEDAASALACPPDYLAVPLLVLAGAAIGASRALEVKAGWRERPCLYGAVVGPPGSTKTPALKQVAAPIYREQTARFANYRRSKVSHEEAGGHGTKPTLSTVYVSDITTEALAGVLRDNPHGIAIIRDELTAWISSMDQYRSKGRGSDRQFFLSAWAGEPVSVYRKTQEDGPVFVPNPFVAVIGGLPPDLLSRLRGDMAIADGFLDRILFSFPEPTPAVGESWAAIGEDGQAAWSDTVSALLALQQEADGDGGHRPRFVRLDTSGRTAWEKFTSTLAAEMNGDGFPDCLRGPWSKMRGYCARLALIVHLLRLTAGDAGGEDVDGNSVSRAAWLVRYFQAHARKVYCAIDADRDVAKAKRLLDWIIRERRTEFRRRDPFEDLKNMGQFPKVEYLDEPLGRLTKHNYIRAVQQEKRPGPGRPPAPAYEVNPCVIPRPVNPENPGN